MKTLSITSQEQEPAAGLGYVLEKTPADSTRAARRERHAWDNRSTPKE